MFQMKFFSEAKRKRNPKTQIMFQSNNLAAKLLYFVIGRSPNKQKGHKKRPSVKARRG
jgi:hypothetical protein